MRSLSSTPELTWPSIVAVYVSRSKVACINHEVIHKMPMKVQTFSLKVNTDRTQLPTFRLSDEPGLILIYTWVGFEVVTAMPMKGTVFWATMPSSSERFRRFGWAYRLHLQAWIVGDARTQQKLGLSLLHASVVFLLGVHLYSEDGCDMFLRNVGLSPNYIGLQPLQFKWLSYCCKIT
jgi:hypothetical protein